MARVRTPISARSILTEVLLCAGHCSVAEDDTSMDAFQGLHSKRRLGPRTRQVREIIGTIK